MPFLNILNNINAIHNPCKVLYPVFLLCQQPLPSISIVPIISTSISITPTTSTQYLYHAINLYCVFFPQFKSPNPLPYYTIFKNIAEYKSIKRQNFLYCTYIGQIYLLGVCSLYKKRNRQGLEGLCEKLMYNMYSCTSIRGKLQRFSK